MSFGMLPAVKERNMRGPLSEDRREPWSELKVGDLLSVLAFGASLEEIANFLIDNVAEREIIFRACAVNRADSIWGQAAIFLSRPRCFSIAETRTSTWRRLSRLVVVVIENLGVIDERGFHVGDVVLGRHLLAKIREIVLGGHVLDDMAEHFAEFLERRFLGHAFEVMSL